MCAAELDTEAPGQVTGRQLHFVIVGAGLGGLTAAIALRRAGQRVTVSMKCSCVFRAASRAYRLPLKHRDCI